VVQHDIVTKGIDLPRLLLSDPSLNDTRNLISLLLRFQVKHGDLVDENLLCAYGWVAQTGYTTPARGIATMLFGVMCYLQATGQESLYMAICNDVLDPTPWGAWKENKSDPKTVSTTHAYGQHMYRQQAAQVHLCIHMF
jgi:hypothetical protein